MLGLAAAEIYNFDLAALAPPGRAHRPDARGPGPGRCGEHPQVGGGPPGRTALADGSGAVTRPRGELQTQAGPSRVRLDRSPHSVVPDSPTVDGGVVHQVGPRCPRRLRWLRRRPHRRGAPGRRTHPMTLGRASRTLPVVAAIPVPVRGLAPARVPCTTRAPASGLRGRRLGRPFAGAATSPKADKANPPAASTPVPNRTHSLVRFTGFTT